MSENNDYIQLPPLKKDTPSDVVAFMWEYMKVPEASREKVKNLLKDANENGVKLSRQAPDGYVSSDEVLTFDASYQGQDVETVVLKQVKKNQPTTVEITKADATTSVELDGAYLKVTDKDGNVVDTWISSKETPHVIKYLKAGETYTLHEEFAPHGYLVANDVTFTVKDTGSLTDITFEV